MIDFIRLSEEGVVNWLKSQLQKREFMYGHCFTEWEVREQIYNLLFYEGKLETEDIERFFIPFGQAGFLSQRQKVELMMFICEKEYGDAIAFLYELEGNEVIRDYEIDELYLRWAFEDRLVLSSEEKREFFVQYLSDRIGLGILELLKRMTREGILLGECCPMVEGETMERRIAICNEGRLMWFPFLAPSNENEVPRIIKQVVAKENKGELTMIEPFWECVREDGTCITAIRPPAGKSWGLRILYGSARRGMPEWEQ